MHPAAHAKVAAGPSAADVAMGRRPTPAISVDRSTLLSRAAAVVQRLPVRRQGNQVSEGMLPPLDGEVGPQGRAG